MCVMCVKSIRFRRRGKYHELDSPPTSAESEGPDAKYIILHLLCSHLSNQPEREMSNTQNLDSPQEAVSETRPNVP
jgi:hypothetical protein